MLSSDGDQCLIITKNISQKYLNIHMPLSFSHAYTIYRYLIHRSCVVTPETKIKVHED